MQLQTVFDPNVRGAVEKMIASSLSVYQILLKTIEIVTLFQNLLQYYSEISNYPIRNRNYIILWIPEY